MPPVLAVDPLDAQGCLTLCQKSSKGFLSSKPFLNLVLLGNYKELSQTLPWLHFLPRRVEMGLAFMLQTSLPRPKAVQLLVVEGKFSAFRLEES